ncbi:MAG: hypothetical protein H8D54_03090 [Candidatus Omnitrophica bacterium]|nr:hypothetical protein [Candidatus Omnitrophota bacterium]
MKKLFTVIMLIVAVLFVTMAAKNIIAKQAVSAGVRVMTGLKLDIKSMDVGIVKTLIGIRDLRLFNPSGFEDRLMVDMPEIYVDYDLAAFFKGKTHLEKVRLNLQEFTVVKNKEGKLNLDSLKTVKKTKETAKKESKMSDLQIDVLELRIGKVIYKDYSNSRTPRVREFNVNINERYENITDPYAFANLIVVKALINTSIASLTNFDIGLLSYGLEGVLGGATDLVKGTAGVALDTGEKLADTAKEATENVADRIKNILPFGK